MKKNILFLLVLLLSLPLYNSCDQQVREGDNYYLDAENGNDANNGLSAKKAWKSMDKLKDIQLKAGDSVLFRRGSSFTGNLDIQVKGRADCRVVFDAYGSGNKPCISAPDSSLYTIRVFNSDYVTVQNLEVVNKGSERMNHRVGVKIACENHGVSHNVILNALVIRDVNGGFMKNNGEGSGIMMEIKGDEIISRFDSLWVENCVIRRCERNAIIWKVPSNRNNNWAPSTNVVFRKNLIEEVPGDGIVPIACEGALVEYNLMRNCPGTMPDGQAAAGMWPWSCDNTILQYNEVSDHKAPWDAQGFDSDYNCTNTTIQYNYSHDNEGGFILICDAGRSRSGQNIGNIGTVVQYNISISDGIRTRNTRVGIFSPTIHIAGPCENTRINNNILHVHVKPQANIDRTIITSDSWNGYANNTNFFENIFYVPEISEFELTNSTNNTFKGNYYLGNFKAKPKDPDGKTKSDYYQSLLGSSQSGFEAFASLFEKVEVGDGAAVLNAVNKKAIEDFFAKMANQ